MRFFQKASDGGKDSGVTGLFFVEIKPLFSVVLLHFSKGTREAFHSHAFNAVTWWLSGQVEEHRIVDSNHPENVTVTPFGPSFRPKFTSRDNHHKVFAVRETWALSFRGPWVDTWREYLPSLRKFVTLTHGRRIVQ